MYNKNMFENNLSKLTNNRLKEDLQRISITSCIKNVAFVKTHKGNVVFLKGDIPTDDTIDPVGYAKSLVTRTMKDCSSNDIIVTVGIGVGYILDELYNSTKAKIVIYEPDVKFLRFVFEAVDLTQYLIDKRVFISNDLNECTEFIYNNYLTEDKLEFLVSPILSIFYKNDYEELSQNLYSKLKAKIVDMNTIKAFSKKWVENVISFISKDKSYYSLEDLKWAFTGKQALILGAGPSLKDNIEQIKKYRDKFVIFSVNKNLEFLEKHDIVPDFAVFADAKNMERQHKFSEEYISKINIISDWKADIYVSELKSKSQILYFSDNEFFIKKYARDLGIQLFSSEQTTSIISLMCANYMDFENIYFCGLDLAFKDNVPYFNDNEINISNGTAIISNSKKQIVEVPSVTGGMVQTREDYALFIKTLETIVKTRGLKNVYNITSFGALINGVINTSFENINLYSEKPDISSVLSNIPLCKKDFIKYLEQEKSIMINIHNNIINRSPVNLVVKKIINETTLLYEYIQFELLELPRTMESSNGVDEFYSKCILAIDRLTAIMP